MYRRTMQEAVYLEEDARSVSKYHHSSAESMTSLGVNSTDAKRLIAGIALPSLSKLPVTVQGQLRTLSKKDRKARSELELYKMKRFL